MGSAKVVGKRKSGDYLDRYRRGETTQIRIAPMAI